MISELTVFDERAISWEMKRIDLDNWPRRAHFEVFRGMARARYSCTVSLDVTETVHWCKQHQRSFDQTMIYQVVAASCRVENFRLRIDDGAPVLYERVHPVFTDRRPDEELFWLRFAEVNGTLEEFFRAVTEVQRVQATHFDFAAIHNRSDLTFVSCLTELSFSGLTHTQVNDPDSGSPRMTWGKYSSRHGRLQMPFNVEVHHALVDGVHVERFVKTLQEAVSAPVALS